MIEIQAASTTPNASFIQIEFVNDISKYAKSWDSLSGDTILEYYTLFDNARGIDDVIKVEKLGEKLQVYCKPVK